jgi:hypothetical protein
MLAQLFLRDDLPLIVQWGAKQLSFLIAVGGKQC